MKFAIFSGLTSTMWEAGLRLWRRSGPAGRRTSTRPTGSPCYTLKERMDRFDEACQVLKLLRTQPKTTFEGRYYRLQAAPLMPKPLQRPQPELLAGAEARR